MTYRPSERALRLAVVLRHAQWSIDDAAYKLPMGIYLGSHCAQLASDLEEVVKALRDYESSPGPHSESPGKAM